MYLIKSIQKHYCALSAVIGAGLMFCAVHFYSLYTDKKSPLPRDIFKADGLNTDVPPEVLSFKYRTGRTYQTISRVKEAAYLNKRLLNKTGIVTRSDIKVIKAHDDGSAALEGTYMSMENSIPASNEIAPFCYPQEANGKDISRNETVLTFGASSSSSFERNGRGEYTISNECFMPAVRGIPMFPETPLSPGDTWKSKGYEAEDFRRAFGIDKPFMLPFEAKYEYLGAADGDGGQKLNVIDVKYYLYYEGQLPENKDAAVLPMALIKGYCREMIYWNNALGEIDHYTEDFNIEIKTFNNEHYVLAGSAECSTQVSDMDDLESVKGTIADMGLENVTVKRSAQGLTISMERIQFKADSTVLQDSEKAKLRKIAEIISPYNNDLLVTGHCALFGDMSGQAELSEGRAKSVANYLAEIGARDREHIFTQGKGGSEAIAPNNTAEGRALNRRVEITLMD